jgi:Tol biopolymer transport system component
MGTHFESDNIWKYALCTVSLALVSLTFIGCSGRQTANNRFGFIAGREIPFKAIYFAAVNEDGTGLVELARAHYGAMDLSSLDWDAYGQAWSRDGQLTYIADEEGTTLGVVKSDGTNRRLFGGSFNAQFISWSPDSRKVLVSSIGIYTIDIRTKAVTHLIEGNADENFKYAMFSPNGRRIAFAGYRLTGESYLYVMDSDGTHLKTFGQASSVPMYWSPDSRKLLYSSSLGIRILDVSTNMTVDLGLDLTRYPTYFRWSPDGKKISFQSSEGFFVMDSDGTNKRQLVTLWHASWLPDSRRVVGEAASGGMVILDTTTGAQTQVPCGYPGIDYPVWLSH